MERQKFLDDLSARLRDAAQASPVADLQANLRAVLTGMLGRLDLVTREEFDVQREVLARTRERLEVLERQIAELERAPAGASGEPPSGA